MENKIFEENQEVSYEYYTETDCKIGTGTIVWINDTDCVVVDQYGYKHMMQISCISTIN